MQTSPTPNKQILHTVRIPNTKTRMCYVCKPTGAILKNFCLRFCLFGSMCGEWVMDVEGWPPWDHGGRQLGASGRDRAGGLVTEDHGRELYPAAVGPLDRTPPTLDSSPPPCSCRAGSFRHMSLSARHQGHDSLPINAAPQPGRRQNQEFRAPETL